MSHAMKINRQFWASYQNGRGDRDTKVQLSELPKPHDLDLDLGAGRGHKDAHIWSRSTHTPN